MRCPVCLSPSTAPALTGTDILFETTSRVFKLDSCAACHCLFLNPAPDTDEIAGYYPELNALIPLWHHAKESKVPAAKAIEVLLERGGRPS